MEKFNQLNNRQKEFLKNYDITKPITYKEYMDLFKISKTTARRDLNYLIEHNFVYKEKKDNKLIFHIK